MIGKMCPTSDNMYKPSEIISIFENILAKQTIHARLVFLRGVYVASGKNSYGGYFYDFLRDEDREEGITILVSQLQRINLKDGNLVSVGGVLHRFIKRNTGQIQLFLRISRVEIVQEQVTDENEAKRMELRKKKTLQGFRNVDADLEQLLYEGKRRPQIAVLLAQSSITMSDFEAGVNAAKVSIDFKEFRSNFAVSKILTEKLRSIDSQGYDAIAIVRGGGEGIEKLDNLDVLKAVINLKTPIIAAVGHVEDKLFIKQLVDKVVATPNGLGQYFSEMVEKVSEKLNESRAALTEQIRRQFKDQLEAGQRQNKELQEKLAVLTKNQAETTKKHHEQIRTLAKTQQEECEKHAKQVMVAQEQNKKLQEKLTDITKSYQEYQKRYSKNMEELQAQIKYQSASYDKRQKELNESLKKMQDANADLNKNLTNLTDEKEQLYRKVNDLREVQTKLEQERQKGKVLKGVLLVFILVLTLFILILLM